MSANEKRQKEEETALEQKRQELTRKANDVVITGLNECLRKGIPAKGATDTTRWKQNKEVRKSLQEKLPSFSRFGSRGKVQLNLAVGCKGFKFSFEGALFYEYIIIYLFDVVLNCKGCPVLGCLHSIPFRVVRDKRNSMSALQPYL